MDREHIHFRDEAHRAFYLEKLRRIGTSDSYWYSLLYLLALCPDTRRNFDALVDMDEHCIRPEGLHQAWQTGTSPKKTRLAFILWNGCMSDDDGETPSSWFAPDEIFCCCYQSYFCEAIRLRFPEYADG